ncbi:MAG: tetratricopeptide repeat protein [Bacteroidota bacterium]
MRQFSVLLLLAVMVITWSDSLLSQSKADSLRAVIAAAEDDRERYDNRILLAETLRKDQPDSTFMILRRDFAEATVKQHPAVADISYALALAYEEAQLLDSAIIGYDQTLRLAQQFNNRALAANALINQSYLYNRKNELQKGLMLNKQAYAIGQELDDIEVRSRAANSLGRSYSFLGKFDSSSIYLQQAIDLFKEKPGNNVRRIFELMINIGNNLGRSGKFDQAIAEYEEGLALVQAAKDSNGICYAYRNMGAAHYFSGAYPAALEVLHKAVDFLEGSRLYEDQIMNLDFLGDVYLAIEDYDNAGLHWQRAADLSQLVTGDQFNPNLLFKVGRVRLLQGENEAALDLFNRATRIKKEQGQFVDGDWYRYLGKVHQNLGQFAAAEENYQLGIELAPLNSQQFTIAQCLLGLGEVSEAQAQYDQATSYYQRAEQSPMSSDFTELRMKIAAGLYRMYKREGNSRAALRFLEQSKMIQDSVFNRKSVQAIGRIQATNEFEQEKRELAFAQAREEARQANIRRALWGALALAGVVLVIGALYFRNKQVANRKLSKLNAEIQQQKEQLEALDESKSRFFTNISHEFRTPLTIIKGMAGKIVQQPEVHLENGVQMIQRNAGGLLNLVNQILDLSKLTSRKMALNPIQGDVVNYLQYLTQSFQSYAEQRDIGLHFSTDVPTLPMDYDPDKIQRIATNLLSNAIKFTPPGGRVHVHLGRSEIKEQPALRIVVQDSGIGIPAAALPHVFDRFYQVDNSATRTGEGTGIGLALSHELVELMGGTIKVASIVDEGSTFSVLLPISNQAALATQALTVSAPDVAPKVAKSKSITLTSPSLIELADRPNVLIVEDNPDVQQYLVTVLEGLYNIDIAENGAIGVERATETIPDLIISDVMMPEKDGYELTDTLKNGERTSHIPIILLTAKSDFEAKMSGLQKGADAYLSKPFEEQELLVRIDKLLELRKKLQERYAGDSWPSAVRKQTEDPFLRKLYDYLEEHLDDAELNMDKISRGVGMSRTQVFRKLKALTGQSVSVLLKSLRLQKGRALLLSTDLTVSEVTYEVGFTSLSYFSTAFLEEFGMRPSGVRDKP